MDIIAFSTFSIFQWRVRNAQCMAVNRPVINNRMVGSNIGKARRCKGMSLLASGSHPKYLSFLIHFERFWSLQKTMHKLFIPILIELHHEVTAGGLAPSSHTTNYTYKPEPSYPLM